MSDFVSIWRHHQKIVYVKCAWRACPHKKPCRLHKELEKFTQLVDFVRDHNLNHKNKVISKIAFIFEKNSCRNELDLRNLIINIWDYTYHINEKGCIGCHCCCEREKALKQNLQKQNKNWVNFGKFLTKTINQIYYHLLKDENKVF